MKPDRRRSGIALILVLMLVVLTTIIIIAFFGSIKTETSAMRSTVGVQNSRQLADLAVQTVISQIQQATQSNSTRNPGTYSWASQPGMIRTYDNTGAETEWYKLYSAQNMTVASPNASLSLIQSDLPETTGTTGNWALAGSANYGVFTDLNSPVTAADGTTLEYPIMNPASATSIAKAAGTTSNAVLGFDIDTSNDPGFAGGTSSATNNQAPMPVRWLYVLQDGTLVPGVASATSGVVTVAGANSSNKQIVGRVAFWTDDDTCKLNVNTAADGSYFDTPRFASAQWKSTIASETTPTQDNDIIVDRQMAISPPVANEFQRYVGNPAQTRLSFVLGSSVANSGMVNRSNLLTLLSPFMQWGGSDAGSLTTFASTTNTLTTPTRQSPYATLDEWMFNTALNGSSPPTRVPSPGTTAASPPALLTNTRLQQLRFFLSANSDAPEVNLFGQPRISMWPVYTGSTTMNTNQLPTLPSAYVTTFDQLIANAATLTGSTASPRAPGNTPNAPYTYYFGRNNSASPTFDWSGTSTVTMSLTSATNNTRNQNIFAYLRTLGANPVPGYGFSFKSKYSSGEMDQILTEIFDYCRSLDPSDLLATSDYASTGAAGGTYGEGQVTPICIPAANFGQQYTTQGFGRFDSISDVAIDFTKPYYTTSKPIVTPTGTTTGTVTIDTDPAISANSFYTGVIYLGLNSPAVGYPALDPHIRVVVQTPSQPGTINMSITTDDGVTRPVFGVPNNSANSSRKVFSFIPLQNPPDGGDSGWNNGNDGALLWGGPVGARQCLLNKRATQDASTGTLTFFGQNYMLCGLFLSVPNTCKTFSMAATPLEIKIYHTNTAWSSTTAGDGFDGAAGDLVQDITITLPAFTNLPLPTNASKDSGGSLSTLEGRLWYSSYGPQNTNNSYMNSGDVIESLVAGYNGDSRLIAAQHTVNDTVNTGTVGVTPSSAFVPHPLYGQANVPSTGLAMAHSFWDIFPSSSKRYQMSGYSNPSTTSTGTGVLATGATYPSTVTPASGFINPALAGTANVDPGLTGDWDNGLGHFSDGPYINKADEVGFQYYSGTSGYFGSVNSSGSGTPLYYDGGIGYSLSGLSSPNRSVASPVMFGSLPTGVPLGKYSGSSYTPYATKQGPLGQAIPWQTLLFRPQAGHYGGNNGGTTVEDEQILDWFWMPVVQPYAISTALATQGKVNMNYQIAPFTYLTRATALMGVLGSEYVISCPTTSGSSYKNDSGASYPTYRSPVKVLEDDGYTTGDTRGTLRQFKDRFATGEIFRSAAEICDIYLEPKTDPSGTTQDWTTWDPAGSPTTGSDAAKYWANEKLTGDNTRERPYNGLYSRLTTKSNTYTVHVRAQSLKAAKTLPAGEWIENPQQIVSEYRGSVTVNRYLDPQDTNIPDFMTPGTNFGGGSSGPFAYTLDNYYKYRVLETRQFLP